MAMFMENLVNSRKEYKYVFPIENYSSIKRVILQKGFFKQHKNNFVNNLYMDKNSTSFDQNIEGVAYRTKFRFRWYDGGYISLEEKIKKAGVGYKRRDSTNFTKIENLDFSNFDKIKNFKPIVMNRYFREYFINSEGERITLDSMIKFKAYNSLKTVNSEVNILEIKSSTESYPNESLLRELNLRLTKFSKYVNGVNELKHYYDK